MIRGRMLARIGARFDELLSHRVFDLVATMPLKGARQAESMQPIRDLDTIRGFLASLGPDGPVRHALHADLPHRLLHDPSRHRRPVGGRRRGHHFPDPHTDAKSKGPSFEVTRAAPSATPSPRPAAAMRRRSAPTACWAPGQALRRGACPSRQRRPHRQRSPRPASAPSPRSSAWCSSRPSWAWAPIT